MSNCDRCGKPLPGFFDSICQKCESIEREREEDKEREEEREEQAAKSREQSRENLAAVAARIEAAQAAAAHKNAAAQAAAAHKIEAAQAAAAHKIANPGEYDCPTCGYKTLKRLASRCPICRADTPSGYWTRIIERERAKAEAARKAQEEWDRAAPARVAAAKAAKEEWDRAAAARAAEAAAAAAAAAAAKKKAFVSNIFTFIVIVGSIWGVVVLLGKSWDALKDGASDMEMSGYQKRADSGFNAAQKVEKITIFELTPDWNERNKMRLPAMRTVKYYCSEEGAEMAVTYSAGNLSAGNINIPSGQAFKCPTDENDASVTGVDLRNTGLSFRSKKPGVTATVKILRR